MHHATLQHEGAWSFGDSKKCSDILTQPNGICCRTKKSRRQEHIKQLQTALNNDGRKKHNKSRIGREKRNLSEHTKSSVGVGSYDLNMSFIYARPVNATIGNAGKKKRGPRFTKGMVYNPNHEAVK